MANAITPHVVEREHLFGTSVTDPIRSKHVIVLTQGFDIVFPTQLRAGAELTTMQQYQRKTTASFQIMGLNPVNGQIPTGDHFRYAALLSRLYCFSRGSTSAEKRFKLSTVSACESVAPCIISSMC